jgi:hypothetical protein
MTPSGSNPAPQELSQELVRLECELARLRAVRLSGAAGVAVWMRLLSIGLVLALVLAVLGGMWLVQAQESGRLRPAKSAAHP